MSTDATATVAILTRNRRKLLEECVGAILPQLLADDEIVVVDTGSVDGTREWLSGCPAQVKWISCDGENTDFAAARNLAVTAASGDILAFVDDDCLPQPDWLSSIRISLGALDAVGGLALFGRDYRFPMWWSPEITWAVGMSGPSLIRSSIDDYPSTSNLAARRTQFVQHRFQESPHAFGGKNIYFGGREDAEWWGSARRRGARTGICPEAVVLHRIPEERLNWNYVLRRTRADGRAAWERRPCPETARCALNEFVSGLFAAPGSLLKSGAGGLGAAAANLLWSSRQHSMVRAARKDLVNSGDSRVELSSNSSTQLLFHAVRRRLSAAAFSVVRRSRATLSVPDKPRRLLVAAPTFFGDSLLLQSAVRMLAESFPETEVEVWSSYPALFRNVGKHVRAIDFKVAEQNVGSGTTALEFDVVFAPYYEQGDPTIWRSVLSKRGVIFDREMGFSRDRDYHLAARVIEKSTNSHELLNLVRLLSLWDLTGALKKPAVAVDPEAESALRKRCPPLFGDSPYVALQMRDGIGMKDWPLDRWAALASQFVRQTGTRIVLHEPQGNSGTGEQVVKMSGLNSGQAMAVQCNLEELAALLERAAMAVGVCSGPKHLAMALSTPTYTLYGPTDPVRWGALFERSRHGFIRSPAGTLTAREHQCLPANHAMLQITPDEAVSGLLAHWKTVSEEASPRSRSARQTKNIVK